MTPPATSPTALPVDPTTAPDAPPTNGLSWRRFLAALSELSGIELGEITPDTPVRSAARGTIQRGIILGAIGRLGRGLPPDLLATIDTFGEAHAWCIERWASVPFPGDLAALGEIPGLTEARVELRTIEPPHLPLIYRAVVHPRDGYRWRFRGATPDFGHFESTFSDGVLAQYLVVERTSGTPQGLVVAYNARFDSGHCSIGFVRLSPGRNGEMLEGMFLLIDQLFRTWPLRKVYAEIPEFNYIHLFGDAEQVAPPFPIEGRLTEHEYFADRWWDLITMSIRRDEWDKAATRWRPFLR